MAGVFLRAREVAGWRDLVHAAVSRGLHGELDVAAPIQRHPVPSGVLVEQDVDVEPLGGIDQRQDRIAIGVGGVDQRDELGAWRDAGEAAAGDRPRAEDSGDACRMAGRHRAVSVAELSPRVCMDQVDSPDVRLVVDDDGAHPRRRQRDELLVAVDPAVAIDVVRDEDGFPVAGIPLGESRSRPVVAPSIAVSVGEGPVLVGLEHPVAVLLVDLRRVPPEACAIEHGDPLSDVYGAVVVGVDGVPGAEDPIAVDVDPRDEAAIGPKKGRVEDVDGLVDVSDHHSVAGQPAHRALLVRLAPADLADGLVERSPEQGDPAGLDTFDARCVGERLDCTEGHVRAADPPDADPLALTVVQLDSRVLDAGCPAIDVVGSEAHRDRQPDVADTSVHDRGERPGASPGGGDQPDAWADHVGDLLPGGGGRRQRTQRDDHEPRCPDRGVSSLTRGLHQRPRRVVSSRSVCGAGCLVGRESEPVDARPSAPVVER